MDDATPLKGAYGRAVELSTPDIPASAETVCTYLVTAPHAHPLWVQYMLCVVRLTDGQPGFPPPVRHFAGATHELLVVALNPQHGPYNAEKMTGYFLTGTLPVLRPVNIAHQIEGTDDEARQLAGLAVRGIVHGALWPETSDAPDRIRHGWDIALIKTLAHIRGEEHAP